MSPVWVASMQMSMPRPRPVQRVLAHGHVDAVVVEYGRGDDLAGTDVTTVVAVAAVLAAVAVPVVDRLAVADEYSGGLQSNDQTFFSGAGFSGHVVEGLEGVAHAVAGAEEDLGLPADLPQRGRRPLAVKHPGADLLVVVGRQPAARSCPARSGWEPGVKRHFCRRPRRWPCPRRAVALDQHRAVGGVVRPDLVFLDDVDTAR